MKNAEFGRASLASEVALLRRLELWLMQLAASGSAMAAVEAAGCVVGELAEQSVTESRLELKRSGTKRTTTAASAVERGVGGSCGDSAALELCPMQLCCVGLCDGGIGCGIGSELGEQSVTGSSLEMERSVRP